MISTFSLSDLHRLTRARPAGFPRFTIADLQRERRQLARRRDWMRRRETGIYYTASDTLGNVAGTVATWTSAGGSGFGGTITCTSLASGSLRQGTKSTTLVIVPPNGATNAVPPDYIEWYLQVQFTSAPTANGEVGLYLGFSDSSTAGTNNPAGLSGTDAAGPNTDTLPSLVFAGSLVASNNLGTAVQLAYLSPVPPLNAYVCPVIYNNTSVALDATAAHTIISAAPYWRQRAA
jgi:hypothetical protein